MAQRIVLDIQMLIEWETLMIASQPQGTCSKLAELLSAGEVKSKPVWLLSTAEAEYMALANVTQEAS